MKYFIKNMQMYMAVATLAATAGLAQAADIDVVKAFYSQLLSGTTRPDISDRVTTVLAPDWQSIGDYSGHIKTRDDFIVELQHTGAAVPDLNWKIEEIIHQGDRYIVRGHATGTPVTEFFGVAPAGRHFDMMSIDIHTMKNHKIVKSYHIEDWHGALAQLQATE